MSNETHEASETTKSLAKLTTVETSEKTELAKKKKSYDDIVSELTDLEIESDGDFKYASDVLKQIKIFHKQIETKRKKVTDPLNAALREFRSWYKPALTTLEEGEKVLKQKIGDYTLKKNEEREEAMRKIAEASASGDFDAAHRASRGIVEAPAAKGITVKENWDYSVVDFDKVPREFLCVDHSAMKIHIKKAKESGNDPEEIPGIKFEKTTQTIARTQ